ncbi:MAG TPA: hypothetical protein DCZ11_03195 [Gammaproteobacteria bacterium]|nr:hypothetical protein [Gammaproteobacteria bacterium]MCH77432.1 hypothetical protein [Gammaproteobacteria bacterium]
MSPLLQKQMKFAAMVSLLLDKAHSLGFLVTLGDAYRDPRVFGEIGKRMGYGHPKSAHKQKLAIDLNLYTQEGRYLDKTEDHRPLGEWWESMGGTWGGRFEDGNHYSLEYQGIK